MVWIRYCGAYSEPMTSHAVGQRDLALNDVMAAILKV